ncbi:MAG: hypothetical protein FWC45_08915, partial [Treponema sp.]|nr:hypothetical protein [Treponema sp.]
SDTSWPLTAGMISKEILDAQDVIQQAVYGNADYSQNPRISNFFRTPFSASQNLATLKRVTAGMGLSLIYGPGSGDYLPSLTAPEVAENMYNLRSPYCVIINHDPQRSHTIVDALGIAVPKLKEEGYRFVTISEMERLRGNKLRAGVVYESLNPDLP